MRNYKPVRVGPAFKNSFFKKIINKFWLAWIFPSIFTEAFYSSFSLQAESSESLDTRNCIFYENIENCEAPKVWKGCASTEILSGIPWLALWKHFAFYYICIYFFLKFRSLIQRPGTGTVFCLHSWEFWGVPMTAKCSKRTNENITLNKKWPSHSNQEGNCQWNHLVSIHG